MPNQTPRARARLVVAYGVRPAHELLRAAAGRFHGVPPTTIVLGHECPRCGSDEHGRPLLLPTAAVRAPAHVSLARAGRLSVVALTDVGPLGVDAEAVGAAAFPGFDDVALHPDERGSDATDPTRVWVRKEALLKAHGLGLAIDPSGVRIDDAGYVAWDAPHAPPGPVWLRDLEVPGHVVAVVALPEQDAAGMSVVVEPASDSPSA